MSAVAEKTAEQQAADAAAEAEQGFDVVEGGATQASNVVPLSSFLKQKEKWKGRVEGAKQDAAALKAENDLLRMQIQQMSESQKKAAPRESDFKTPEEYGKALEEFVEHAAARKVNALQPKPGQAQHQPQGNEEAIRKHYERAAKLKAPDFDDAENAVIDTIGQPAARAIIEQFPNSEAIVYALGKNPTKLSEIASELKTNPVKAIVTLTNYAAGLTLKPRTPAPDPDKVETEGSGGGGDMQAQLDKLRERKAAGKATMADILKFKTEARAKGVKLT